MSKEQEQSKAEPRPEETQVAGENGEEKQSKEASKKGERIEDSAEGSEVDAAEALKNDLAESKDKYLRLYSEFENFRRRTAKEKLDMVQTANEDLMLALLPTLDDFERAGKAMDDSKGDKTLSEGLSLIQNKLIKTLEKQGLKAMTDKKGSDFNPELHEAISRIPVDQKKLKGKIVDVVERGYKLGDKVIRFAKVVIGS